MELEPERLSTEIIPPDLYLTEESISLAAVVDAIDNKVFKKWKVEDES